MKRTEIKSRPLADKTVAALEPEVKAYRERDSNGLYLYVRPNGRKGWELRYRKPDGKYSWLGLGSYPAVRPKEARHKAQEARDLLEKGITPRQHRKQLERQIQAAQTETVKALMDEWHEMKAKSISPGTLKQLWATIERHIIPAMGSLPIFNIQPADMLAFFRRLEARGIHATSAKLRCVLVEAFDLATFAGRVPSNPVRGVERFVESSRPTNLAHVTYAELPDLIRAINLYPHSVQVRVITLLLVLNVCRPCELRKAKCNEFDLDNALWTVPAERMKMRRQHIIPLAPLSVELIREQLVRVGGHGYLFPNARDRRKCMDSRTINKGLEYLGYAGRQTGHGFRHIFSTALHERGYPEAHIEAQLAHKKGGVAGVYNKAAYIEQRRVMMEAWANDIASMMNTTPPATDSAH